jgi:hypothetical protein
MRTWHSAERHLRRDAAEAVVGSVDAPVRPLVAAVGAERPSAVIALRGFDPDRPSRTVSELVLLAAAFRPERVLVGTAIPDAPGGKRGLVVVHDLLAVADGLVETTRAWRWRRVVHRLAFWPAEVRRWETIDGLEAEVARTTIEQRPACPEPALLRALLCRSAAAGHRVRLAFPLLP